MQITKLGHCCLLIKYKNLTILTDPGSYTIEEQSKLTGIDLILITHEHSDHFHIESLKELLKLNPEVKIITNSAVGKLLDEENIKYEIVENGQNYTFKDILIEGFGEWHELLYKSLPPVQNTGYFIDNTLFYPGDALTNPNRPVEILALPVAGPWINVGQAVDYAIELNPKVCFPVHDAGIKSFGTAHRIPDVVLNPMGIKFVAIELNKETEFN